MGTSCFCLPVSYIPSSTHLPSEVCGTSLGESKSEASSTWMLCTRACVQCLQSTCSCAHLATTSTFHLIGCQWFSDAHLAMCNLHSHLFLSVCLSPVHISWSQQLRWLSSWHGPLQYQQGNVYVAQVAWHGDKVPRAKMMSIERRQLRLWWFNIKIGVCKILCQRHDHCNCHGSS